MRELDDAVDLELRPRFPLFGGWKTRYVLGYNVPSYEYLYNKGQLFPTPPSFFSSFFWGGGCWKSRFLFNQRSGYYLLAESWMFAENKTAFQWVKIQSTKNEKKVEGEGGHLLQCIFMLFAMAAIGADRCRCKIWSHLLLCEILPSGLGKCYFALGSRLLSVDVMFFQPVRKISWADTIEKGMSYAKYIDNVCVNKWTCSFHLKTSRNSQL